MTWAGYRPVSVMNLTSTAIALVENYVFQFAGVTRQVGDALLLERSQRSSRVVSIGIAPWGIVENNHELLGHNRDAPYHSISLPRWVCTTFRSTKLCRI